MGELQELLDSQDVSLVSPSAPGYPLQPTAEAQWLVARGADRSALAFP